MERCLIASAEASAGGDHIGGIPEFTRGAPALPASPALVTVQLSAPAAAGRAPPSIGRAQAAIAHSHARAAHLPPRRAEGGLVIAELAGIAARAPPRRAESPPPTPSSYPLFSARSSAMD